MTYRETINDLLKKTKRTTIFGMFGYSDSEPDNHIGFRRECRWSDLKDPAVDGIQFMLCADAYDEKKNCKIKSLEQLFETPNDDVRIELRAVTYNPYITIQLGSYSVFEMHKYTAKGANDWDFCIRLEIGRDE